MDGATYAANLGSELTKRGIACYLDQYEPRPGLELPSSVKRALRRASVLLLVATRGGAESRSIEAEIDAFARQNKAIQVVDLHGTLAEARWFRNVAGAPTIADPAGALAQRPSAEVVERIDASLTFKRRGQRIRLASIAAATLVVVSIAGGGLVSWVFTQRATEAAARERAAREQTENLERQKVKLQEDIGKASEELGQVRRESRDLARNLDSTNRTLTSTKVQVRSQALATVAREEFRRDRELGILLATAAAELSPTPEAHRTLRDLLGAFLRYVSFGEYSVSCVAARGRFVLTAGALYPLKPAEGGFTIRDRGKVVLHQRHPKGQGWSVCSWGASKAVRVEKTGPSSVFDLTSSPPRETHVDFSFDAGAMHGDALALSPDGGRIAQVRKATGIKVWNIDGTSAAEFASVGEVKKWAFTSATQIIVVTEEGQVLGLEWGPTGTTTRSITSVPRGYRDELRASPDGRYFVLRGSNSYELWRADRPTNLRTFRAAPFFAPDGEAVAFASLTSVHLTDLDPETGLERRQDGVALDSYSVEAGGLNPELVLAAGSNRFALLSASTDVTRILDPKTGVQLRELPDRPTSGDGYFSDDGRWLFTGKGAWDLFPRGVSHNEELPFDGIPHAAKLSDDGRFLGVWSRPHMKHAGKVMWMKRTPNGWKELWAEATEESSCTLQDELTVSGHRLVALRIGSERASAEGSAEFRVLDQNGAVSGAFSKPAQRCQIAAVSPDGRTLVTATNGGAIEYLAARATKPTRVNVTFYTPTSISWSPNSSAFAVSATESTVIVEAGTRAVAKTIPAGVAAFDPEGARLLTGDVSGRLRLWQRGQAGWASATIAAEFSGNHSDVTGISWASDGRFVLTTGRDGVVRAWDVRSGDLAWRLTGTQAYSLKTAAFQAGTRKVLSVWGKYYRVDECEVCLETAELVTLARGRVARRLTAQERKAFSLDTTPAAAPR